MNRLVKAAKWIGLLLLLLFFMAVLFFGYVSHDIENRAEKIYRFTPESFKIENDSASIKRGEHLVIIKGCNDCHASDLGGKVFLNDPKLGRISAPNLTSGQGGIGKAYKLSDWIMALRHGVNKKRKALWIMPSQESAELSQMDLHAIIAYCRQVKPVNRDITSNKMGPVLKVMAYLDKIPLFPVEKIDHKKGVVYDTRHMDKLQQGKYLSISCIGCHRESLHGGESPIPGMPIVPDITGSGNPGKWSESEFRKVLRTGLTPSGHQMQNAHMPWKMTAHYTDKEISALYAYLRSLK